MDADSDFAANDGLSEENETDLTLLLLDATAAKASETIVESVVNGETLTASEIVESVVNGETLTAETISNSIHSSTNEPVLEQKMEESDEIPAVSRGQYKIDFDDPNIDYSTLNPFGGKVQMANSPAVAVSKAPVQKKSPKMNGDSQQVTSQSPAAKTPERMTTANESPNSVANASPRTVYNTPPESQSMLNTPSSGGTPNRLAEQDFNDVPETPTAIHNNQSNQSPEGGTTVKYVLYADIPTLYILNAFDKFRKQPVRKIFDESEQLSQVREIIVHK